MTLDLERALELQRANLRAWFGVLADHSDGAHLLEHDGVTGVAVPAVPERSVANSVTYDDAERLAAALPALGAAYDDAGVNAWTVWTPEGDTEAIAALKGAGHRFDGQPAAMTLLLSDFEPLDLGDLDWDRAATPDEVGRLNDEAYGYEPGNLAAAIGDKPYEPPVRSYRARVGGEVACVLQTMDSDADCGIYWVATDARHRGRGLAKRLMSAALVEARERGCETSTLQATGKGYPVYERLGYRTFGRLHMYERRK
jgi:GNAT superfamily N-acetyltransferase